MPFREHVPAREHGNMNPAWVYGETPRCGVDVFMFPPVVFFLVVMVLELLSLALPNRSLVLFRGRLL
jgi:hypothetical protein